MGWVVMVVVGAGGGGGCLPIGSKERKSDLLCMHVGVCVCSFKSCPRLLCSLSGARGDSATCEIDNFCAN